MAQMYDLADLIVTAKIFLDGADLILMAQI